MLARRMADKRKKGSRLLRTWRAEKGILQEQLAEILGISQEHISRLESGRHTPGLDLAHRIEDVTLGAVSSRDWLEVERAA